MARGFIKKMITMIKKQITVIKNYFSDALLLNHRNQTINLLYRNHRNQFAKKTMGQSIAEYSILIAAVTAALLAMQLYMKRGIQAAIKHSTDQFGNQEYMETDPEKAMQQDVLMQSLSETTMQIHQEGVGDRAKVTYTFDDNSTNIGESVYWKEEEL